MALKLDVSFLLEIETIAIAAGSRIMKHYKMSPEVRIKDDGSSITLADLDANEIICSSLKRLTPDIPILSEESYINFTTPNQDGFYWLVDPLDGTKEFINNSAEFTVNIAMIRDGRPVLGVVLAPALNVLYSAVINFGAYKVIDNDRTIIIPRVFVDGSPLKVVVSRSHLDEKTMFFLSTLDNYELIKMGSSLKFCLIAEGGADFYPRFGPTSLWDTAAAQCVVEQSGAKVMDFKGDILSYKYYESLLNPSFSVSCAGINPSILKSLIS